MAGRLQDKIAIITGAGCVDPGWGNGRAAAVIFAREGAKIFAIDLRAESMEATVSRARNSAVRSPPVPAMPPRPARSRRWSLPASPDMVVSISW